jgi:APA family basic amino acid/polyamine antiporter
MLVMLLGQPRIFYSMARDGLFPAFATKVHPRFGTPHVMTIVSGVLCALAGGFLPLEVLGHMTSIGTLFAFVLVSIGVMVLRLRHPDLPRAFRVPGGPYVVPLAGAVSSGVLMCTAPPSTLVRLFAWMAIGLVLYAFYGRVHSKLRKAAQS